MAGKPGKPGWPLKFRRLRLRRRRPGEQLALPPDFEAIRDKVEPHLTPLPDIRQWRPATT